MHVQHLMELTRPVVKEIGRGGSVEADSGIFYTHYTNCETHKTVNTRNIYGMLMCCEKANKA